MKVYVNLFFRHNAITLYALGNQKICVTLFIAVGLEPKPQYPQGIPVHDLIFKLF